MTKSEEYLEGKKRDLSPDVTERFYVTLEHAKTYGKIVELECEKHNGKWN